MPVYQFENRKPVIDASAYVHPHSVIIGRVEIGPRCFIGPGAVIRGDYGKICINSDCTVEDGCILHTEPDTILILEDQVIIGHRAVVHGPALIKSHAIIGMASVLCSGCEVNDYGFLAAGSVLPPGRHISEKTLFAGNPAQMVKPLDEGLLGYNPKATALYRDLAVRYKKGLVPVE